VLLVLCFAASASANPMGFTANLDITVSGTTATPMAAGGHMGLVGVAEVNGLDNAFTITALTKTSATSIATTTSTRTLNPVDGPVVQGVALWSRGTFATTGGVFSGSFAGTRFGGIAPLAGLSMTLAKTAGVTSPTPWTFFQMSPVGSTAGGSPTLRLPYFNGVSSTLPLFTLTGTGWQTGIVTFTLPTTGGGTRAFTATGLDSRTPSGEGMLSMVTPIRIESAVEGGGIGGFATYSFMFSAIPEPTSVSLIAGALVCLAMARHRRS
jgi:hypothetical protein